MAVGANEGRDDYRPASTAEAPAIQDQRMEPSDEELALARGAVEARQGPQPAVREAWVERDGASTLVHVVFGEPNDTAAGDRYLTWIVTLRGGAVASVECLGSIACSPR
jgi:hypothetical protein